MPSRVIISSVNRNTPANALAPTFRADCSRCSSISRFMRCACRHMWTMSDATSTAATRARMPSQSAWFDARWNSIPAAMLSSTEIPMPQWTAGMS